LAEFHVPTVAIVGGDSLIAREIRDCLGVLKPPPDIRLIAGDPDSAKLVRDDQGDAMVLAPLDEDAVEDVDVVFLAGNHESSLKTLDLTSGAKTAVIDVTGCLDDHPRARLRAPQIEKTSSLPPDAIHVSAHPAAVALALFFERLAASFVIERAVVEVFEPASERGQAALTELQTQTINLLSFKSMPKDVYDAQLGFNMLPEFGKESPHSLEEAEARIERHLATLLIPLRMTMPSLRLIQAPVFHGYSCSLWIELKEAVETSAIEEAVATANIEVRRAGDEAPTNVGVAGEDGLVAGAIRADRNNPRAYWIWLVADNLRTLAATAVAVARERL
jgi:aspartate-semialdehyde dehydrogenase